MAVVVALWNKGERLLANGTFQGYNGVVIGIIALQAAGGLFVAIVFKECRKRT